MCADNYSDEQRRKLLTQIEEQLMRRDTAVTALSKFEELPKEAQKIKIGYLLGIYFDIIRSLNTLAETLKTADDVKKISELRTKLGPKPELPPIS